MTLPQTLDSELIHLRAIKRLHDNLQNLAQSNTMHAEILREVHAILGTSHVLLLNYNPSDASLEYSQAIPKPTGKPSVYLPTFNADEGSITKRITAGECLSFEESPKEERLANLVQFMNA